MTKIIALGVLAITVSLANTSADAAELRLMISNGMKEAVHELAPQFERASGHKLTIRYDTAAFLLRDLVRGETIDLAVIPLPQFEAAVRAGRLNGATKTAIAQSRIGVAVRKGAAKPDISTTEAFKRTMLNAKAIAYSTEGTSGVHFMRVCEQLGIAAEVKAKGKTLPGGVLAEFVVKGEAELAIQQISELLPVAGVELVGPFPPELQLITPYTAAVGTAAKDVEPAKAFIAFLKTPAASAVMKAKGLDPS